MRSSLFYLIAISSNFFVLPDRAVITTVTFHSAFPASQLVVATCHVSSFVSWGTPRTYADAFGTWRGGLLGSPKARTAISRSSSGILENPHKQSLVTASFKTHSNSILPALYTPNIKLGKRDSYISAWTGLSPLSSFTRNIWKNTILKSSSMYTRWRKAFQLEHFATPGP